MLESNDMNDTLEQNMKIASICQGKRSMLDKGSKIEFHQCLSTSLGSDNLLPNRSSEPQVCATFSLNSSITTVYQHILMKGQGLKLKSSVD